MTISASAVVACFGVHDFVYTLITSSLLGMSTTQQEGVWFGWAIIITAVAVVRQIMKKKGEEGEGEGEREEHAASGARFWDLFEAWLVCFAFWIPWQTILETVYEALPKSWSGRFIEGAENENGWGDHLLRLIFQLLISTVLTLLCAIVSVILRPGS